MRRAESKSLDRPAKFYQHLIPPASPEETHFRHSGWSVRRERVREALRATGHNDFFLNRFDECGSGCSVEWSPALKTYRLRADYCRCRHCEPCSRARANVMGGNLKRRLNEKPAGRYRFITLTLRGSDTPLADQLKRLYAAFKKLRGRKEWKRTQKGGAAILEVKWMEETGRWHPHLHVISEGLYIAQRELSGLWLNVTGDSSVVDIRPLEDSKEAVHYLTKYVTKGTSNAVWGKPDVAQEWVTATKGVRVAATFGTWRGFALMEVTKDATDWRPVATLNTVIQQAKAGVAWAMAALLALRPPGAHDAPPLPFDSPPPPDNPDFDLIF